MEHISPRNAAPKERGGNEMRSGEKNMQFTPIARLVERAVGQRQDVRGRVFEQRKLGIHRRDAFFNQLCVQRKRRERGEKNQSGSSHSSNAGIVLSRSLMSCDLRLSEINGSCLEKKSHDSKPSTSKEAKNVQPTSFTIKLHVPNNDCGKRIQVRVLREIKQVDVF